MKIQSINFAQINNTKTKIQNFKHENKIDDNSQLKALSNIPTKNYLAFMGGMSLDLASTVQSLKEDSFPLDIRKNALEELEKGNSERKTLNDIHFEKYSGVLDCFTLDELKEKYPEFSGVQSAYELEAKPNSTLDRFQKGESQIFPSDEDLSLQLVKLYWGRGFSLGDIAKYVSENAPEESRNLHYLINEKLNIPLMNNQYARMLKLSNREYNEKFTAELGQKIKDAREMALQKEAGEPVFIPRKPLTEAHKEHISQGLIKYYEAHPEKPYELSERQKEYFKNNPDQAKKFSEALDYAWNKTQDGKLVKKKMTKFLNKFFVPTDDELSLKEEMSPEKKNAMREFWGKNTWAKEKFSKALKDGWEYANFDIEGLYKNNSEAVIYRSLPKKLVERYVAYAQRYGYDVKPETFGLHVLQHNILTSPQKAKLTSIVNTVFDCMNAYDSHLPNKRLLNCCADAKEITIMYLDCALEQNSPKLPESLKDDKKRQELLDTIKTVNAKYKLYHDEPPYKHPIADVKATILNKALMEIMVKAAELGCQDIVDLAMEVLDKSYEEALDGSLVICEKVVNGDLLD